MKKTVFILNVFCVISTAINVWAKESGYCGPKDDDGNYGTNCEWSLDDNGKLTITGSGEMANYAVDGSDKAPWTDAVIEADISGISSIGTYAFLYEHNLKKISVSDSITKLEVGAIQICLELEAVEFSPNSALSYIGGWSLYKLPKLEYFDIPNGVTYIGPQAFYDTPVSTLVLPESLFEENAQGLSAIALENSNITKIYCPKGNEKCKNFNFAYQKYNANSPTDEWKTPELFTYEKYGNGYFSNGKFYSKFNDIGTPNYIKKRIYTVEEATKASGKKNTIMIRYQ